MSVLSHPGDGYHGALHVAPLGIRGCCYGIHVSKRNKPFTPNRTFLRTPRYSVYCFVLHSVGSLKWYIYVIFIQMLNGIATKSIA